MKLTKQQLKQIIREEVDKELLAENATRGEDADRWYMRLKDVRKRLAQHLSHDGIWYFRMGDKDLSKLDPKFWPKTKAAVAKTKQALGLLTAVEREYGNYLTSLEEKARAGITKKKKAVGGAPRPAP
tara:strand:- start:132 stop:512 length:381 start_codon:yes stop_codon:yes gene_type:complete